MGHRCALNTEQQAPEGRRLSLPPLPVKGGPVSGKPRLHRSLDFKLDQNIFNLTANLSRIPSISHGTTWNLNSRHMEVSQWQSLIFEWKDRVDQEITAVEQAKEFVEHFLQEKKLYSQLCSECVALNKSSNLTVVRHDRVFSELKKEECLTNDAIVLLQEQICNLLHKLSCLRKIRGQLTSDFRDKGEAVQLMTKCIVPEVYSPSSQLPIVHFMPNQVSYDQWLNHCKDLRLAAQDMIQDSVNFRGNLRFTLNNLRNVQEQQRRRINDSMKKKINDLSRVQHTLSWERQRIQEDISDLNKEIDTVVAQMKNCESKMLQVSDRLDILNRRPGYELCLDRLVMSLIREKHDLTKMLATLALVLKRTQQDLAQAQTRLMILEDKVSDNTRVLEVELKCRELHQGYKHALQSMAVLANRPKLPPAVGRSSCQGCFL